MVTFFNSAQPRAFIRASGTSPEAFSRLSQVILNVRMRASVWKKWFPPEALKTTSLRLLR